jgi:hypothetical protein
MAQDGTSKNRSVTVLYINTLNIENEFRHEVFNVHRYVYD